MGKIRKINSVLRKLEKAAVEGSTPNDWLFGSGEDGDVTITNGQTVTLSSDMYYDNLTVNSGGTLFTNGFRVFVNDTLTNNGTIGFPSGSSDVTTNPASISRRSHTAVSYGIGQASNTVTEGELYDLDDVIGGYYVLSNGTIRSLEGGDPGTDGADGSITANATAGNAGSAGTYPGAAVGAPGGAGNPGTAGNAATAGTGGSRGAGGGVVLIIARTVTGSGEIVSLGTAGTSGNAAVQGTDGSDGTAAPNIAAYANPGNPNPAGHNAGSGSHPANSLVPNLSHNATSHPSGHNAGHGHHPANGPHGNTGHNASSYTTGHNAGHGHHPAGGPHGNHGHHASTTRSNHHHHTDSQHCKG